MAHDRRSILAVEWLVLAELAGLIVAITRPREVTPPDFQPVTFGNDWPDAGFRCSATVDRSGAVTWCPCRPPGFKEPYGIIKWSIDRDAPSGAFVSAMDSFESFE